MPDTFVAAEATIKFRADISATRKDFDALNKFIVNSSDTTGIKYARGFEQSFRAVKVGENIAGNVQKGLDPNGAGKKTGKSFVAKFSSTVGGLLKSVGNGLIVGLGIDAIKFGFKKVTEANREAEEQITRHNQELEILGQRSQDVSRFIERDNVAALF